MQHVYWDVETFSQASLKDRGAHIYANDKTTGIFFFCYAVDDGDVKTWRPGDPVPEPFADPETSCSSPTISASSAPSTKTFSSAVTVPADPV